MDQRPADQEQRRLGVLTSAWTQALSDTHAARVVLLTRRRPRHDVAGSPMTDGAPAAIVELHVTEDELLALDPAAHPAWAAVLHDRLRDWQRARAEGRRGTGGLTLSANLGPAGGHDHDAKTTGGWTVHQHRPGRFTWTSPTGNRYEPA